MEQKTKNSLRLAVKGGWMKRFVCLMVSMVFLAASSFVYASGFFLYHQDTKAQGQAGAFTAQADNPSAVYYNPAGMSQLDGTQFSVGSRFFRLETEYKNPAGLKENLDAKWEAVPSIFLTSDFKTEKWTFGLGVFAPYGLSTSWSDKGLLRYVCTDTSFKMVDINPSVAYQICPQLSIGGGIDYYNVYSYTSEYLLNLVILDSPVKLDVDGDGWGFNLGALWKPAEKHSFGLAYRSRVDIDFDGELKMTGFGLLMKYPVKSKMTLPGILSGGYAFKPTEKLKLELDLYWVDWSTIDEATVTDKDTDMVFASTEYDWKNALIGALGAEYLVNDKLSLRAGYSYQPNVVPEKTYIPNVPDSDLHVIALGLGYSFNQNISIDLAYALGLYTNRDIDNDVGALMGTTVDGKYDSLVHIVGASINCKF
jgi:long-chain fatty acid transport protein